MVVRGLETSTPVRAHRLVDETFSRRTFMRRGALAATGVAGLEMMRAAPAAAWGSSSAPKPIPGGAVLDPEFAIVPKDPQFHFSLPYVGFEMSTITDFNGVIAAGEVQGTASGSDGTSYTFDCDMRFMAGEYVGEDNRKHLGTFGFV
jgi:hypothetical protein